MASRKRIFVLATLVATTAAIAALLFLPNAEPNTDASNWAEEINRRNAPKAAVEADLNEPIPDGHPSTTAEPLPNLTTPIAGADSVLQKASPFRLLQDSAAWDAFRSRFGAAATGERDWEVETLLALRLPKGASSKEYAPKVYHLTYGLHIVLPANAPRVIGAAHDETYAIYRIRRPKGASVRSVRYEVAPASEKADRAANQTP